MWLSSSLQPIFDLTKATRSKLTATFKKTQGYCFEKDRGFEKVTVLHFHISRLLCSGFA